MFHSIAGKSAIVTGASKGIGRDIAHALVAPGVRITLVARSTADLEKARTHILAAHPDAALRIASCDVADRDAMQAMVDGAADAQGGLDILCANAGIYPQTAIEALSVTEWDGVMVVNARSSFIAVKAAQPHPRARGQGRIILTSFITGPATGLQGWSHYGASKVAQLGFMRSAALELARDNVTINAVLPGNIPTEGLGGNGSEYREAVEAAIPLGRLGTIEGVANAVLFLASNEAAYITAQQIIVGGGQIVPESLETMAWSGGGS